MPNKIIWKQEYNTGIEDIDVQHQYFAMLINRLSVGLVKSKDEFYNGRLLDELSRYASFHFVSEENIMIHNKYPFFKEHRELHLELINELNEKINLFRMAITTIETVINFLMKWFIQHTVKFDRKIGQYCEGVDHTHVK